METITTLVGYQTKSGNGQRGPWTLHLFNDAAGQKYQTFDGGLANRAGQLMHQPVRVAFDVKSNNGYQNNELTAIELAPQGAVVQQPAQQPMNGGGAHQPQSSPTDDSKRRWAASQVAVVWLGFLPEHERTIESLIVLSEQLIRYYQNGPNAFVGTSSPVTEFAGDPSFNGGAGDYSGHYTG